MKNNSVTKSLSIEDFFKIYPDIIPKNENFDEIHKFYDIFKKPLLKEENENNGKRLSKSISKLNISPVSLLGLSLNQRIRKININISKDNSKKESTDSFQNEQKEIDDENKSEYNYFLIQKAIFLQNKKKKRTEDVKKALEYFLFNSSIIEKLTNNLSVIATTLKKSKKFTSNKKNETNNQQEEEIKIGIKLNTIVLKLAERVLVKKYPKNKFVVKMNEIGEDCYFLISGKLSILKPVEYKLKLTYKDYFIYLKSLMDLNEIDLVQQVLNANRRFLDITNIKEVTRLIRVYFAHTLKMELDKKVNGITLKEVETFFKEFNYSFEDFKINKEKMMKEIKSNLEQDSNFDILLRNYICDNISMSTEDLFLLDLHNIFNTEKERKAPLVNLFRYEIFLFLYPGSFFGDAALENTIKKRNASIRCEEDCIICSLSNLYYSSLIAEENKKLKIIDLQFLLNNFFFKEISPNIFNKYYYPMFKVSEKKRRNDIIYKSNEKLSSIYLLKDGIIKTEINANINDLMNLIKKIIKSLYLKSSNLKIALEQIMDLKKNYLKDDIILETMHNKDQIISDKQPRQTYNLYYSNGFECLGLLEYCLNLKFLTTCTIVSDKAIIMEITKEDLSRIFQNEREIVPSYYNFVHMNALSLTKRLYFLKSNLLNKLVNNINEKQKDIPVVTLNNSLNNHKPKIEIINSDKVKTLYNPKIKKSKDKFGGLSTKKVNVSNRLININTKKNISSNITEKTLIKEDSSLFGKEYNDIGRSLHTRRDNKNIKKFILKQNENEKNIDKNISVVNIRNKILSINLIKKGIEKEFAKKKNLEKLNIVSNFHQEDEKSFIDEIINNKYINEKNRSLGSDEEKSPSKDSFTNYYKNINIKGNEYKTNKKESPNKSLLPNIKYSEQKIKNLIKEMKRNYNMNNGQTKFVFYRKSKANKVYDNIMRERNSSLSGQKSARNIIKDYYLKKKIGGYSSIVNPSNNTYINRQKTFKVKTSRAVQKNKDII